MIATGWPHYVCHVIESLPQLGHIDIIIPLLEGETEARMTYINCASPTSAKASF